MSVRTAFLSGVSCVALLIEAIPGEAADLRTQLNGAASAVNAAASAVQSNAAQAAALAQQSQQSLAATMRAIQATQAAQAAARAAAISGPNHLIGTADVQNGLGGNGLVPDSGLVTLSTSGGNTNFMVPGSWQNIGALSQTKGNGSTTVTITQNAPAAIANWTTFNVGKSTILDFNQQGNQSWIVLNRVLGTAVPSQILGQIRADGEVLLINQNGIIFGGSSQINVHTLIASTLDISIDNPTFAQNGLFSSGTTTAIFNKGMGAAVTVDPGAVIDTTQNSSTDAGGFVALLGANGVTNDGTIATANGQIVLAAGTSVSLMQPASGAEGTQAAFQVLGNPAAANAKVVNGANGLLVSSDGAVTIWGGEIDQFGTIEALSSTARPASIILNAGSNVILGPSSVTTILPDEDSAPVLTSSLDSTVTVTGTNNQTQTGSDFSLLLQPQIKIQAAGSVDLQGRGAGLGGALIKAPGAALSIAAGSLATPAGSEGTILLEAGSNIDLSGLAGVSLPMSANFVTITKLDANVVADDPLAQSLIGQTVTIDTRLAGTRADGFAWVGSPLLDASDFVGDIPQTIDQVLTVGGSFTVSARNVIALPGSAINLSGGSVAYQGGVVSTTRVLGADGRIYDIGSADPNVPIVGIAGGFAVDHAHWGVTETFTNPLMESAQFEPGYVAGANAGSFSITGINPILEGSIRAGIVAGDRQRALAGSPNAGIADQMPTGVALNITFVNNASDLVFNTYDVVVEPRGDAPGDPYGLASFDFKTASAWTAQLANDVFPIFSDELSSDQFAGISIKGAKQLDMPAGAILSVRSGGSITLDGIATIDGTLNVPSGTISLTGLTYQTNRAHAPPTTAVVIGPNAVLNVRGLWVNDTGLTSDDMQGAGFVNGGSVSITTLAAASSVNPNSTSGPFTDGTESIVLSPGSVVDASSGGYVGPNGTLSVGADGLPSGKGGSVSLITYSGGWSPASAGLSFHIPPNSGVPNQANVVLAGTIFAEGFDGGGTFSVQAPIVTIDGTVSVVTHPVGAPGEIVFPTSFFLNSGFAQYTLTSTYGDTTVTAGTQLVLRGSSFLPMGGENQIPTGAIVRNFEPVGFQADDALKPVSLTLVEKAFPFAASDPVSFGAGVLIESRASIEADPQASVSLVAGGPVTVLGSITVPGGTINLLNNPVLDDGVSSGNSPSLASADVWIGANAMLDVSGTFVPPGRASSTGTLLDGGTITLGAGSTTKVGTIVAQKGARFDLHGVEVLASSDLIEGPNASAGLAGPRLVAETEWSNGGSLQLAAGDIYFAGSVNAVGGAPQAAGGTLTLGNVAVPSALTNFFASTVALLPSPNTIVVEPGGVIAANLPPAGAIAFPNTPSNLSSLAPSTPGAFIGADTLSNSGFDSVSLNAGTSIAFNGSVTVSVPGALTLNGGLTAISGGHFVLLPSSILANGTVPLLPPGVSNPTTFTPPTCFPTGGCVPSVGAPAVTLSAGYIEIVGSQSNGATPKLADGTLTVTAQWIDFERVIVLDDVLDANFTSSSATRLLPSNDGFIMAPGSGGQTVFAGALIAPGNLTLTSAEVYPVSNTVFVLMSTGSIAPVRDASGDVIAGDSTLTILQARDANGRVLAPVAPVSAGGGIALEAQTIMQEGTLWAPLGTIALGIQSVSQIPTSIANAIGTSFFNPFFSSNPNGPQNVTLGPDSLTSVSAAGLDIPDGYTVDGTNWYQGTPISNISNQTVLATVLAAPPAKSISMSGLNIATQSGAVVDLSGGGDIYATEFVSGTGGTRNVLTTYEQVLTGTSAISTFSAQYPDGRQVYALVPGSQAKVAVYDPMFADYPYYSAQAVPTGTALSGFLPSSLPFNNGIAPGTSVTIGAGSGIPAGTYTLLPGMYATLPGAFRVVEVAGNANPLTSFVGADGSQYISGSFSNALTGARSSQQVLFQLQSQAVWSRYSQIDITSGTAFFSNQAINAGNVPPPLPVDGGVLSIGATGSLTLLGTDRFAPGTSSLAPSLQGSGGQVDIGGQNILVLAADRSVASADQTTASPYLILDADQISNLGAESVLIGGSATPSSSGVTITATALNVEVETDVAHPLTGPEVILVTQAGGSKGLTVDQGSVIRAIGVAPAADRSITIGAAAVSGDGALLRVSNGSSVTVTRLDLPASSGQVAIGTAPGTATLVPGASVTIAGSALTVDTSGSSTFAPAAGGVPGVTLAASNYDLSASVINIGGGTTGLVLDSGLIANFAGAASVTLRSASVFNLFDVGGLSIGDAARPIGTLTFDGSGLFSQGGMTTINATNVALTDSQTVPNKAMAQPAAATGTLNVDAGGTFTEGSGGVVLGNFGQVNVTAGAAVAMAGAGSLDFSSCTGGVCTSLPTAVTLSAPVIIVKAGATQSLTTDGPVTILQGAGTARAPVATDIGGAFTVTAAAVTDSGTIQALSGNVTLNATSGDVVLEGGARIAATGAAVAILDQVEFAPGGTVKLVSNTGNVTVGDGVTVDVSAAGTGYAGSIMIVTAPTGRTMLDGALEGSAAFKDVGGNLVIETGTVVSSNSTGTFPQGGTGIIEGLVPTGFNSHGTENLQPSFFQLSGMTGSVSIALQGREDIVIPAGTTLAASLVGLLTNNGRITVDGTIDASGPNGGSISLYGAGATDANGKFLGGGVTVNAGATLDASWRAADPTDPSFANGTSLLVQNGGTIALGTTGTPTAGVLNNDGSEQVSPGNSGVIMVASGATLDVQGGSAGSGGQVILRAPITTDAGGNTNVGVSFFKNAGDTVVGGGSVVLDAYKVWSTDDPSSGGLHFDGIIDPAGWFDDTGKMVDGSWAGATVVNLSGGRYTSPPTVIVSGGGGPTETATPDMGVGTLLVSGSLTGLTAAPTVTVTGGGGSGAVATASLAPSSFTILNAGTGYISSPTVTISGGGGTGATAFAEVSGGKVIGVFVESLGSGYTSTPTVTLTGGGGSGASVSLVMKLGSINVTDGGSGYTSVPTVMVTPPAGASGSVSVSATLSVNSITLPGAAAGYSAIPSVTITGGGQTAGFAAAVTSMSATANETDGVETLASGSSGILITGSGFFTPATMNADHHDFYQQTLVNFVQNPFNSGAVQANFGSGVASVLHLRPEIDLVNPDSGINGGNITIASNWNLGGATDTGALMRTASGEPGVLALRAVNDVQIDATVSDGFAFPGGGPGNQIANDPAIVNGTAFVNTTAAADLMPAGSGGSFSYDFVAGAAFGGAGQVSADPNAVSAVTPGSGITGNVTINGHTSYADNDAPLSGSSPQVSEIVIPTLVRTGTGSITIAAAGNVELLDSLAPGAIYTAGAAVATPADFTAPAVPTAYLNQPNGLLNTPTWATGGGAVVITAGQSIIGIETPVDNNLGSQTGVANGSTGQFWSDWYDHYGKSNGTATPFAGCTIACQTAAWINYATFFQGFGALGGGNVKLKAGADIVDVGASLPETLVVGGGTTANDPPHAIFFGGGNLLVNAGGDLLSSDFLVGRGAGLIQVGGSVQADLANPITGLPTLGDNLESGRVSSTFPLPLLLAVQDGFVSVGARGSVTLGNVFDPASLSLAAGLQTNFATFLPGAPNTSGNVLWGNPFTTFGPASGVSLGSTDGDVTALTVGGTSGLFLHNDNSLVTPNNSIGALLPATIDLVSLTGNVVVNDSSVTGVVNANLLPYPTQVGSDTGTITIVAGWSINLGLGLAMPDLDTAVTQYLGQQTAGALPVNVENYINPLGVPEANLTQPLHANDVMPVIIAAGDDLVADVVGGGGTKLTLIKPAEIEAGHNIVAANLATGVPQGNFQFIGENNNVGDITSISAGNDLIGGAWVLYGPGALSLQAGHDMGPFEPSVQSLSSTLLTTSGVATIGDGSAVGNTFKGMQLPFRPYLPNQGAEIDVLFGTGPGIDYAAAINQFVNPASAGTDGISFLPSVAQQVGELLDRLASAGMTDPRSAAQLEKQLAAAGMPTIPLNSAGLVDHGFTPNFTVTTDQAWSYFQNDLTSQQQKLFVGRAFLDFLSQVGLDFNDPTSPFSGQYARAYEAIATLFPAALGYTNNAGGGGVNGAAFTVPTGNLDVAASVLETQMGGDINIIGPGGGITVGHSTRDTLSPNQEGILTLAGGTIRGYTDQSILLNQSRIMTQQGGDIDLFSANGDISAGAGPKTFASSPIITDICEPSGFCFVNPSGLVTGAGIAAVLTLPGQDPALSNVNLVAPHGTIDAGAAGLRGNDINLVALQVLNSFNIQATGAVTGVSFTPAPNVSGALSAQNTSGALQATVAAPAQTANTGGASVIIVEVVGYGGGPDSTTPAPEEKQRRSDVGSGAYDLNSAVQVVGYGPLTGKEQGNLTEEERQTVSH